MTVKPDYEITPDELKTSYKLSILILTHKRPELFKRCVNSILYQKDLEDVEILVTSDNYDITYIRPDIIKYWHNTFYKSQTPLTDKYRFLIEHAHGEYVYFLEDDDFLTINGLSKLLTECSKGNDLILGKFFNDENEGYNQRISRIQKQDDEDEFQLGQVLWKRSLFKDFDWNNEFKTDDIKNDWILLNKIKNIHNCNIYKSTFIFFKQTYNGDNISVPMNIKHF